jgi:hypothetical protein
MPARRGPAPDSGFVLVGVVVFVLALTILVLSLYGLSSYEAQFLQRSIDEEQAFQSAMGGIERAKFALARTSLLQRVKQDLPEGVDSTVAVQDGRETGFVVWDGTNVTIRVTASVNGARRTVWGDFTPKDSVAANCYSSLITVREDILIVEESPLPPEDRDHTVQFDGPIWESTEVPVPDVDPFLSPSGPLGTAQLAGKVEPTPASVIYTLDASATPGIPVYFRAEDTDPDFSVNTSPEIETPSTPRKTEGITIQVRGLAVWLLPRGALFYMDTEITGNPTTDCLVIIAGPKTPTGDYVDFGPTASICFEGRLGAHIPVILVSSGKVLLWHQNDYNENSFTNDLAIFARSAEFMGPDADASPALRLRLSRNPNGPLNELGVNPGFIDVLASHGALPNASSGGRRLDLIPGTWHASDR